MQRNSIILIILITVAQIVSAQTNFYVNVTNLWYQGSKSNVLILAEQRLQQNSNDVAGLIVKMEYDFAFLNLNSLSNSIQRVIEIGQTVTSTNFVAVFPSYHTNLLEILNFIKDPIENLASEQGKGNINYKPFLGARYLEALEQDGYFQ